MAGVNQVFLGAVKIMDISDSTVTPETLGEGATAYDKTGEKITGVNPYELTATNAEVSEQTDLITRIKTALEGKASGGGSGDGSVDTCTVTIKRVWGGSEDPAQCQLFIAYYEILSDGGIEHKYANFYDIYGEVPEHSITFSCYKNVPVTIIERSISEQYDSVAISVQGGVCDVPSKNEWSDNWNEVNGRIFCFVPADDIASITFTCP